MKKNSTQPVFKHLLGMETLNQNIIEMLFDKANHFLHTCLEKDAVLDILHGKIVTHLFFEPSTRTRNSFEIAAKRLGAIVLSPDMEMSSTVKGESLIDTIHTFEYLGTHLFVIRHSYNNTAQFVASEILGNASVINAGDGINQHPTQTLIDLFTIKQYKTDFKPLIVAIIGDMAHSRVARSLIMGLKIMGTSEIRLIAPPSFIPNTAKELGITSYDNFDNGLKDADVIITLRIQRERMEQAEIPDPDKFFATYGLTRERLAYAKKQAIVMHPGPVNRGIEIESAVADGPQSVILQQVRNGVAIRMAVMDSILNK